MIPRLSDHGSHVRSHGAVSSLLRKKESSSLKSPGISPDCKRGRGVRYCGFLMLDRSNKAVRKTIVCPFYPPESIFLPRNVPDRKSTCLDLKTIFCLRHKREVRQKVLSVKVFLQLFFGGSVADTA